MKTRPVRGAVVTTGIRGHHQPNSYSCGTVAFYTVYRYLRSWRSADITWDLALAITQPDPKLGVPVEDIKVACNRLEVSTVKTPKNISKVFVQRLIEKGGLAIATIQQPHQTKDETHWVVVYGFDKGNVLYTNGTLIPGFSKRSIPWDQALKEWRSLRAFVAIDAGGEVSDMRNYRR